MHLRVNMIEQLQRFTISHSPLATRHTALFRPPAEVIMKVRKHEDIVLSP